MHTKKKREEYSKARKQKKELLSTPLYRGIKDVKKLDKHIQSFIKAVEKDSSLSDKEINKQIKDFEEELHEEAKELRDEIKTSINHLVRGLEKLSELKIVQEKATGKRHHLRNVLGHEKKLADALMRGLHAKMDSLEKMFKRLE